MSMDAESSRRNTIPDEVYLVQNPALGAVLIWRFVEGYQQDDRSKRPVLPLLFMVVPILFSQPLLLQLSATRLSSGLRLFAAKFSKNQDELVSIQRRMIGLREVSLSGLSMAVECGLLHVDHQSALVEATSKRLPKDVSERIRTLADQAKKLGAWCSTMTLHEIQAALRIGF